MNKDYITANITELESYDNSFDTFRKPITSTLNSIQE